MLWANAGSHSTRQVPTHAVAATAATAAKIRLISGRSTEPAARRHLKKAVLLNRALDRDIMSMTAGSGGKIQKTHIFSIPGTFFSEISVTQ